VRRKMMGGYPCKCSQPRQSTATAHARPVMGARRDSWNTAQQLTTTSRPALVFKSAVWGSSAGVLTAVTSGYAVGTTTETGPGTWASGKPASAPTTVMVQFPGHAFAWCVS
jgi:hypothetical protein